MAVLNLSAFLLTKAIEVVDVMTAIQRVAAQNQRNE